MCVYIISETSGKSLQRSLKELHTITFNQATDSKEYGKLIATIMPVIDLSFHAGNAKLSCTH